MQLQYTMTDPTIGDILNSKDSGKNEVIGNAMRRRGLGATRTYSGLKPEAQALNREKVFALNTSYPAMI